MDEWISPLIDVFGSRMRTRVPMAPFTTLKTGGTADVFFEANTEDEFVSVIQLAKKHSIPLFIFGGGSNILIGDKGIRGLVVKNNTRRIRISGMKASRSTTGSIETVFLNVESGAIMNTVVRYCIEEGLQGLEMHLGLPGTVGGALYMNSKWTKPAGYVGDVVFQATIIQSDGTIKTVPNDYFRFGYDTSTIQKSGDIVVSVIFRLIRDTKEHLWNIANESIAYRRSTQPQGVKTAGCTFKNISHSDAISIPTPNSTTSAGFLIDKAGLKGYRVHGACVSPIHANFIENEGSASTSDIVQLIMYIKRVVKEKFRVDLEEEIVRVGEF